MIQSFIVLPPEKIKEMQRAAIEEILALQAISEPDHAHIRAEAILLSFLRQMGLGELVDAYKDTKNFYL